MWNLIETRMSWSERNVWFVLVFFLKKKNLLQFLFHIVKFTEINEQFPESIIRIYRLFINSWILILLFFWERSRINNIFHVYYFLFQIIIINLKHYIIDWFILKLICYEIPLSIINLIFIAVHTNTITQRITTLL